MNNYMPAISVIIPSYNTNEELLTRSVNSVLHQNFDDYESLLIADGKVEEY